MEITKKQYLLLLVAFLILFSGEMYSDITMTKHVIPKEVIKYEDAQSFNSKMMYQTYHVLGGVFVVGHLIGLAGLFFFWGFARHLFCATSLMGHIIQALVPWSISVSTGWEDVFGGLQSILVGIILAVSYWPAAHLFEKEEKYFY